MMKRYNAWKVNSDMSPIDGTDRILLGRTKRGIIKHLAYEEGTEHKHNDVLVRCKDGTIWIVNFIGEL